MAKQGGLLQNFYLEGYDLSGDVGSIEAASLLRGTLDVTGLDKTSVERIYARRDGALSWKAFFNPDSGQAHPVLSALPTADVQAVWALSTDTDSGLAVGDPAYGIVAKQANYDLAAPSDGSAIFSVTAEANSYGMDAGKLLTAGIASQASAGSLASLDGAAQTTHGLQAYLQVFSFTGTSITVTIEESSDDGAGDAFAAVTGGAFAAVSSAPSVERIQTGRSLTVERYLRVTTSGTFSAATFAVVVARNQTEMLLP